MYRPSQKAVVSVLLFPLCSERRPCGPGRPLEGMHPYLTALPEVGPDLPNCSILSDVAVNISDLLAVISL